MCLTTRPNNFLRLLHETAIPFFWEEFHNWMINLSHTACFFHTWIKSSTNLKRTNFLAFQSQNFLKRLCNTNRKTVNCTSAPSITSPFSFLDFCSGLSSCGGTCLDIDGSFAENKGKFCAAMGTEVHWFPVSLLNRIRDY